jgi:hypothetical protein
LTIQFGDLGAEGAVELYCRKVKEVTRNGVRLAEGNDYRYDREAQKLTVRFKGVTILAVKGAESLFNP